MMRYFYQNWAKMTLPLALSIGLILFSSAGKISWITLLVWLQFPAYLLHEFEEHAWPGGFKRFFNVEMFHSKNPDLPLNDTIIFWVNILAIWTVFPVCALLAQNGYPAFGVFLPLFSLFDATLHIAVGCIKRKYNPGLIASLFLNYPVGLYALFEINRLQGLTTQAVVISLVLALLGHAGIVRFVAPRLKSKNYS